MNTPARLTVANLAEVAALYSTRGRVGLEAWANAFVKAHARVPFGLSLEVGAHIGGSALLFGGLLEQIYGAGKCPALWSVDPYGAKPYVGGHGSDALANPPIYGDAEFRAMKFNLSRAGFHAHWLMESREFFKRMEGLSYWRPGPETQEAVDTKTGLPVHLHVGVKHTAGKNSCAFILLDGEHSADSIMDDFKGAFRWLHPNGIMVIDNIDTDPYTLGRLRDEFIGGHASQWKLELGPAEKPEWAIIST